MHLFTLLLALLSYAIIGPTKLDPMPIGEAAQYTVVSKNLAESQAFWVKLGFKEIQKSDPSASSQWVQLCDESLLLTITQGDQPYAELMYFTPNYKEMRKRIRHSKLKPFLETKAKKGSVPSMTFCSPERTYIGLMGVNPDPLYKPSGANMLQLGANIMNPDSMPSPLGVLGEISAAVTDLKTSMNFWQKLGFESLGVNKDPYPWTIMYDGISLVGLHQTTEWSGTAVTYFAPDMADRIAKLRATGITCTEMGMGAGNVVVNTPEGGKIFLFSMGM